MERDAPTFLLLGRYGDGIIMLPAFAEIYRRTGIRPRVVVNTAYADIYDGVSFVEPIPVNLDWKEDVHKARAMFPDAVLIQWWLATRPMPKNLDLSPWPNFEASMWDRCGFTEADRMRLPLVFDRRNATREATLMDRVWPSAMRGKPLVLYHFAGKSSPFGHLPELYPVIQAFARDFTLIDLGKIRAERIFDLLGLMECATGMILCDSAPLHLAYATETPYIAFIVDTWSGSKPLGNCVLSIRYKNTLRHLQDVAKVLKNWRDVVKVGFASKLQERKTLIQR